MILFYFTYKSIRPCNSLHCNAIYYLEGTEEISIHKLHFCQLAAQIITFVVTGNRNLATNIIFAVFKPSKAQLMFLQFTA